MRRAIFAVLAVVAVVALAAPPEGVIVRASGAAQKLTCSTTGNGPDGGATQGIALATGATYLFRVTTEDVAVCLYDGGTLPDGCSDGGTCISCAAGGHDFASGWGHLWVVERGGQLVNCRSSAGTGVIHFAPVAATP